MDKPDISYQPSLFTQFSKPKKKCLLIRMWIWREGNKASFSFSVYASIALHVFILLFLVIQSSLLTQPERSTNYNSRQAVSGAYVELQNMLPVEMDLGQILSPELQSILSDKLENLNISGEEMNEEEVSALFSKMLDSYIKASGFALDEDQSEESIQEDFNNFLKKSIEWKLDSGKKVFLSAQTPGDDELNFKVVSDKTLKKLDYIERRTYSKSNYFYLYGEELVRVQTQYGMKYVPTGQFYRDSPYEELLAHGAELFYAIRGFPLIWEPKVPGNESAIEYEVSQPKVLNADFTVFLIDRLPASEISLELSSSSEKLEFQSSDDTIQDILDKLMIHPDEEQLELFKLNYLERYDLNSEDLIKLTSRFIQNNLTNVFVILSDVSAAFDFVEEVYFNKPLDSYFFNFWMRYPTSRIGVEFLLCLASHYDFERRALEYLFKAKQDAVDFVKGRTVKAEIHDKEAKCYVINRVNQDLMKKLLELGYKSQKEVLMKYLEEEEKIYRFLIHMGGEGTNVGQYALGSYYWSQAKYSSAQQYWTQIDPAYTKNIVLQEIRNVFLNYDDLSKAIAQINAILDYHQNKGSRALLERLVRFKRWKNRYSDK